MGVGCYSEINCGLETEDLEKNVVFQEVAVTLGESLNFCWPSFKGDGTRWCVSLF